MVVIPVHPTEERASSEASQEFEIDIYLFSISLAAAVGVNSNGSVAWFYGFKVWARNERAEPEDDGHRNVLAAVV